MASVDNFEQMLVRSGIHLRKYYLDISKNEQKSRLKDRRADPLAQWKISPIDEVAVKHWDAYTEARDAFGLDSDAPRALARSQMAATH